MGASGTSAGVTGVAGVSVTVAEVASPSRIRGVGVVVSAVGAVVKLALGSPNTVDEFRQRERSKMPHTASPRREPRVAQPPCMPAERAACASAQLKLRRVVQASVPTAHNGVFSDCFRMSTCLTRPVRAAHMRARVGRPRRGGTCPRAHTSGRASDVQNDFLAITLDRDDRGPTLP